VRVHTALTLTEMVSSHNSVKAAVAPQVGKVIQGWLKYTIHTTRANLSSCRLVLSIDSSPEILAQVQEVIIPIIQETLEKKVLGTSSEHATEA